MKTWKRMLSCVLALAMLVCLLPAALAADGGHWADQAVSTLNDTYNTTVFQASDDEMSLQDAEGILTAMGLKSDKLPNSGNFTRALACTVLADVFNLPVGEKSAIEYLYEKSIINGYADGTLGEDESISLAQFAVVTYRILNSIGGGAGSTTGLIPGTEEYNSWMFLAVRGVTVHDHTPDEWSDKISEERWDQWIHSLDPALRDDVEGNPVFDKDNLPPCPGEEDESVTKLQAAVELVRAYVEAGGNGQVFTDVAPGAYYYDGVMYLFDQGIVAGYGDGSGRFGPDDQLQNQQLAAILSRVSDDFVPPEGEYSWEKELAAAKQFVVDKEYMAEPDDWTAGATRETAIVAIIKWLDVNVSTVNTDILERFNDSEAVSAANAPYIAYAVSIGLVNGTADGSLGLETVTTRAMFGVIMYRVLIGVDKTKMQDYAENVNYVTGGTATIAMFALLDEDEPAAQADSKTLTLREDWRLTSDLDLAIPAGETLIIDGNGHHIYEMGGILTNSGTGTVQFAEKTYLYPAEGDTDAAAIKAEDGYESWDEAASAELVRRRQPQGEAEAEVGGVRYATLADAIAAAQDGEEVVLLKDITVNNTSATSNDGTININKNITLNGEGHTITAGTFEPAGKHHIINVTSDATIENLTIIGNETTKHGINVWAAPGATTQPEVTITNVTIKNCGTAAMVVNNSDVTATGLSTEGNAWGAVNVDKGGKFTLNSGDLREASQIWSEDAQEENGSTIVAPGMTEVLVNKDANGKTDVKTHYTTDITRLGEAYNKTTNTVYDTVERALADATSGDTVRVINDAELAADTTVGTGVTLVVDDGVTLTTNDKLTNEGTIENFGTIIGSVTNKDDGTLTQYYTISFNANGGECNMISATVEAGKCIYELPTPTRDGYSFLGWYDENGVKVESPYAPAENVTLTAKWSSTGSATLPIIGGVMNGLGSQLQSPFVDVSAVDYYYDAVNWAVDNGITTGTGRYSFSPDEACTRAQAVTFLWRAAGSPAPKNAATPFVDVDANAYYAKAVAWAVENGITNGTSATTFGPSETCTRAQIVTFLYRAFGRVTSASTTFTDVAADAYYAPAVAWAATNNVTGGTGSGKFSPAATCTRAQIVTFLYRCCG